MKKVALTLLCLVMQASVATHRQKEDQLFLDITAPEQIVFEDVINNIHCPVLTGVNRRQDGSELFRYFMNQPESPSSKRYFDALRSYCVACFKYHIYASPERLPHLSREMAEQEQEFLSKITTIIAQEELCDIDITREFKLTKCMVNDTMQKYIQDAGIPLYK